MSFHPAQSLPVIGSFVAPGGSLNAETTALQVVNLPRPRHLNRKSLILYVFAVRGPRARSN